MRSVPTITVRNDDSVSFAQMMRNAMEFDTHGNLRARREFSGFGAYKPVDLSEVDEIMSALYVVYSYDTPIAWLTRTGEWIRNVTDYSVTTSKHQNKVFSAIDLL